MKRPVLARKIIVQAVEETGKGFFLIGPKLKFGIQIVFEIIRGLLFQESLSKDT